MKIIGSCVSPYVRKVLACLALKGLDYEIDPITPFFGRRLSAVPSSQNGRNVTLRLEDAKHFDPTVVLAIENQIRKPTDRAAAEARHLGNLGIARRPGTGSFTDRLERRFQGIGETPRNLEAGLARIINDRPLRVPHRRAAPEYGFGAHLRACWAAS
jgi:hypothetical protein